MTHALSIYDPSNLPSTSMGDDATFNDLAKGGDFLGRLKLFTKGKAIDRGLIPPGHFGVQETKDDIIDLGLAVDVIPFARKAMALDMSDESDIVRSFDPKSAEFQDIAARSLQKESNCQYGTLFLVYERTLGRWLEFFCGTKSTRPEAKKIQAFLPLSAGDIGRRKGEGQDVSGLEPHDPLPLTMKSKLVEAANFSWHVPTALRCSTPFAHGPTADEARKEIVRFMSVKASVGETVEEAAGRRRAR